MTGGGSGGILGTVAKVVTRAVFTEIFTLGLTRVFAELFTGVDAVGELKRYSSQTVDSSRRRKFACKSCLAKRAATQVESLQVGWSLPQCMHLWLKLQRFPLVQFTEQW